MAIYANLLATTDRASPVGRPQRVAVEAAGWLLDSHRAEPRAIRKLADDKPTFPLQICVERVTSGASGILRAR
jgi:hypothetical protein